MRMNMATLIVKMTEMVLKRAAAVAAAVAVAVAVAVVVVVVVVVVAKEAGSRRANGTTVLPQHRREEFPYPPLGRAVTSG
jgi:hypothetical protein